MTKNLSAASGTQYEIEFENHRAVITEIGAMVREYTVGAREVFVPFGRNEAAPVVNGAVLLPWPNRLADGRYRVDGVTYQLALSEPARHNAIHGLAQWIPWQLAERSASAVTLRLDLPMQKGWPFQLRSHVTYSLAAGGLTVAVTTTNIGAHPAPYGIGFHPWLSTGGASLDECTAQLDAATRVTTDERLLPTGLEPVAGGPFDLREPRSLRGLDLDDAFVDPSYDAAGRSWCRLGCPDGRTPAVWMDRSMDVWQVCTADHIPAHPRYGLAAEPMSCYANAYNSGDRLVMLAPGAAHAVQWGATLL